MFVVFNSHIIHYKCNKLCNAKVYFVLHLQSFVLLSPDFSQVLLGVIKRLWRLKRSLVLCALYATSIFAFEITLGTSDVHRRRHICSITPNMTGEKSSACAGLSTKYFTFWIKTNMWWIKCELTIFNIHIEENYHVIL